MKPSARVDVERLPAHVRSPEPPPVRRCSEEDALKAFVHHFEKLQTEFDRRLTGHPVTEKDVFAHHEWQKAEIARFDKWLTDHGWTRVALMVRLREAALRLRDRERRDRKKKARTKRRQK